jgi:hypothetical protein
VLFVWRGAIRVKDAANTYAADERDTIFINGPVEVEVSGDREGVTELIQVDAP